MVRCFARPETACNRPRSPSLTMTLSPRNFSFLFSDIKPQASRIPPNETFHIAIGARFSI